MNYARQYPRFWLAYFVLSVAVFAGNVAAAVVGALGPGSSAQLLGVLLGFVGLWPLYGFVRQRRYNPRWLWLVLFLVTAIATLLVTVICLYLAVAKASVIPAAVALVFLALGAPYLFALQQYIYRSPHLWHET